MLQCGKERPSCERCRRSNRPCSGYEDKYLFVPNNPRRLRVRPQVTRSGLSSPPPSIASDSPSSSVVEIAAPTSILRDVPTLMVPEFVTHRVPDYVFERPRPSINPVSCPQIRTINSSLLYQSQLLSNYTASICPRRRLPQELCLFHEWLRRVPDYLGTSQVLGDAMECLARAHFARSDRKDIIWASSNIYCRAVTGLYHVLNTPERRSPQTLCATLFLSQYEACHSLRIPREKAATNISCSSWLVHLMSLGLHMLAALRS